MAVDTCVRYWEDSDVNGVEDDADNPRIPCAEKVNRFEYHWRPIIEIETGHIINWTKGVRAEITYKVCDEFRCGLKTGLDKSSVFEYAGYVPEIMYPREQGFGDYIEMDIDADGNIADWDAQKLQQLIDSEDNFAKQNAIDFVC
jgi:hypothetical protein